MKVPAPSYSKGYTIKLRVYSIFTGEYVKLKILSTFLAPELSSSESWNKPQISLASVSLCIKWE